MKRLVVMALAVAVLAGCKSQCRLLDEKRCDCAINSVDRNNCLTQSSNNESNNPPAPEDEDRCKALLDKNECDCRLLDTTEGKIKCGLAWPVE